MMLRLYATLSSRLVGGALRRGLLAGVGWGLMTGGSLAALNAFSCGVLCVEDAAMAMGVSILAGCATIGPLAAFASRPHESTLVEDNAPFTKGLPQTS